MQICGSNSIGLQFLPHFHYTWLESGDFTAQEEQKTYVMSISSVSLSYHSITHLLFFWVLQNIANLLEP